MEPGITPGIHPFSNAILTATNIASIEPGITPGIHLYSSSVFPCTEVLQWSPGSLPGYTSSNTKTPSPESGFNGARNYSRDTRYASDVGTNRYQLQWSPGLLPGYTATSFYQGLTQAVKPIFDNLPKSIPCTAHPGSAHKKILLFKTVVLATTLRYFYTSSRLSRMPTA